MRALGTSRAIKKQSASFGHEKFLRTASSGNNRKTEASKNLVKLPFLDVFHKFTHKFIHISTGK